MESGAGIDHLLQQLEEQGYIADRAFATTIFLLLHANRPLLIEGHAGVGKTETAKALASLLQTELIRLQCYEGLDISSAVYEWNYQKQLLSIKVYEGSNASVQDKEEHIFGPEFLLERPLLKAIRAKSRRPVLLIDEIDRADEEFEAFLLELLSDFQITIPEMGTIRAIHIPYIVLTSNRTRELSDALKRRCLYHWIDYPAFEKELRIVKKRIPDIEHVLAGQIVKFVQQVRQTNVSKHPGIAETLDWATALVILGQKSLSEQTVEETIGCLLKTKEDIGRFGSEEITTMLSQC